MENIINGTATQIPAFNIAVKFNKVELIELAENIEASARGIHPINEELLIKKAKVIANVIKIIFLSKIRYNLFYLSNLYWRLM